MGKTLKIFLSCVNVHQKVISKEQDYVNQMDILTYSADTSWPLLVCFLLQQQNTLGWELYKETFI
jgi:hypothetical protein